MSQRLTGLFIDTGVDFST